MASCGKFSWKKKYSTLPKKLEILEKEQGTFEFDAILLQPFLKRSILRLYPIGPFFAHLFHLSTLCTSHSKNEFGDSTWRVFNSFYRVKKKTNVKKSISKNCHTIGNILNTLAQGETVKVQHQPSHCFEKKIKRHHSSSKFENYGLLQIRQLLQLFISIMKIREYSVQSEKTFISYTF